MYLYVYDPHIQTQNEKKNRLESSKDIDGNRVGVVTLFEHDTDANSL